MRTKADQDYTRAWRRLRSFAQRSGPGDFADAAARDSADQRVDLGDSTGQATVFASQFVTFEDSPLKLVLLRIQAMAYFSTIGHGLINIPVQCLTRHYP
jgi:hypothetical protein